MKSPLGALDARLPDPMGNSRGLIVEPLHPNVPKAAKKDSYLYELLALVDALRIGGPREVSLPRRHCVTG